VQIFNPLSDFADGRHQQQGANLIRYAAAIPDDAVLMGDFNSAPWGTLQTEFREKTSFDNRGRLALSWPAWLPAMARLPIDQIFVRGALEIRNYRAGPAVGSDHLPVLAEVYRTSP
jgi:endonuclease/exonuclease/phosphatase (EEP) superfamily protein YafD